MQVIIQYKNYKKRMESVELKEIDTEKDNVTYLLPLVKKLLPSFQRMKINSNGDCQLVLQRFQNEGHSRIFVNLQELQSMDETKIYVIQIENYLAGDLKFLFQLLGCHGYEKDWCYLCKKSKAQWNKEYKSGIYNLSHSSKVQENCSTLEELKSEGQRWMNKDALLPEKKHPTGIGVKSPPIFDLIPIKRILMPKLHITIVICNYIVGNHYSWLEVQIERHSDEVNAAITNKSLC